MPLPSARALVAGQESCVELGGDDQMQAGAAEEDADGLTRFVGTIALRSWLAFSTLAVVGFVVFLFLDGDDPLRSDDPYIVGLFLGSWPRALRSSSR